MPFRDQHPGFGAGRAIFFLLLVALLVVAAVWIINLFTHRKGHLHHGSGGFGFNPAHERPMNSDAQKILEERFARGEIDADEFKLKRDLLRDRS